ncbi:MAG: AMP-binding protein [Gammaproteobacteria bacterium]|nr:AMP-binding protein [Gammaproteobacteria bacterium]
MHILQEAIARHAIERPLAPALRDERSTLRYGALPGLIEELGRRLHAHTLGLLLDNGPAWMLLDLAANASGIPVVPLPAFFSDAQLEHVLGTAGVDLIVTDRPDRLEQLFGEAAADRIDLAGSELSVFLRPVARPLIAPGIAKVTFTSGTTGRPRGVCLDRDALVAVAQSLRDATDARSTDRIVSVLPLATLLENVAVYGALLAGGCACVPRLAEIGVSMTGVDPVRLGATLSRFEPTVIVLVPQVLRVLAAAVAAGSVVPASLRFVAVGGGTVAPRLIEQARAAGLPVYEGYGLTEAASVVSLNRAGADRVGSVGRPLPHARVRVAADGEVLVGGAVLRGYLGEPACAAELFATGDLGHFDADGYLYLDGRKKDVIVNAYGRNIAPHWPESELMAHPAIAQAVVFGDGREFNVALLALARGASVAQAAQAVEQANRFLPEYAAIRRFHVLADGLSAPRGELTANGRACRAAIAARHAAVIDSLYEENLHAVL